MRNPGDCRRHCRPFAASLVMKTLGAIIDRAIKSAVETGRDQHLLANGDHVSFVSGDDLLDAEGDYIGVVSES